MSSGLRRRHLLSSWTWLFPVLLHLLVVGMTGLAEAAPPRTLKYVDEAAKQPSFVAFRQKLIEAVDHKDRDYLLSITSPEIQMVQRSDDDKADSLGSKKKFISLYELDKDTWKENAIWRELGKILRLGGTWGTNRDWESKNTFYAPYVYGLFPHEDYPNSLSMGVVVGEGVNVRKDPSSTAPVLFKLSYEIVDGGGWCLTTPEFMKDYCKENQCKYETLGGETFPWLEIETFDGRKGFVYGKFYHLSMGYRADFGKVDGKWMPTGFVVGGC